MANLTLSNPFVFDSHSSAKHDTREETAKAEYAIVRRGDVVAPEIDREGSETLEVTVRWGRTVLGVAHVKKGESLSIGEDDRGAIMVPEELLGVRSWKLLERGTVHVPSRATRANGESASSRTLARGEKLRFSLAAQTGADDDKDFVVQIACVAAAKATPRGGNLRRSVLAVGAISFLAHLGVVTALAFSPGDSLSTDDQPLDKETSAHMLAMNQAADMHETPKEEEQANVTGNAGGESGQAHSGPSGMAGALTAKPNNAAYQLSSPTPTKEEHLARVRSLVESGDYGAMGALASVMGSVKGPTDPMSAFEMQAGEHDKSFDGNLIGKEPGDSFGYNGLGLVGNDWGGNGNGPGIGLGPVGGFGHGPGDGGTFSGLCAGSSDCGGVTVSTKKHVTGTIKIIEPNTAVEGTLPMEVVKRIVHANFPRLRACYDQGMKTDPELRGTITTRFIIDSTGAVETASLAGNTMSNPNVASCVVGVFSTMSFPSPENGKARVTYPISFDHDNG